MRSPRAKQRMPHGGQQLYEELRGGHEPIMVHVYPFDAVTRDRARLRDTLTFDLAFDPGLYFWPVEHQHVLAVAELDQEARARLAQALLRDGAIWVTICYPNAEEPDADGFKSRFAFEHFGDADAFMRSRYPVDALGPSSARA